MDPRRYLKIFIIVLFSLLCGSVCSQPYQAFPEVDGYWKVQYSDVWCLNYPYTNAICSQYQYIVIGDTTINDLVYHKFTYSGRDRNPDDETWTYWDLDYYGCYRNDAANKRVYYVEKDSTNEILLYDFNLNLNDTLPDTYVYNPSEYSIITVDQIDSILVNNTYIKRYHLDNAGFGGEYLIEGIGSTLGLLSQITPFFEKDFSLLCFINEAEELYYEDEDWGDCDLITGIDDSPSLKKQILLYPNPTTNSITVEFPKSTTPHKNTVMTLNNTNGQVVMQNQITEQQTLVDVSGLNAGVYFVKVVSDDAVMVGKFVKQ